jgi:hypothetical protein
MYDPKVIDYYIKRGRELRAQAFAQALRRLWSGLRTVARKVSARLAAHGRAVLDRKHGVPGTPVASGRPK